MEDNNKDINSKGAFLRFILDGSILTKDTFIRQLPFIFLMLFLAMVYIANRFHAEKIVRDTAQLQNELKELKSESITTASELMNISKPSEVIKIIEQNGLKLQEATEPPTKIIVKN